MRVAVQCEISRDLVQGDKVRDVTWRYMVFQWLAIDICWHICAVWRLHIKLSI